MSLERRAARYARCMAYHDMGDPGPALRGAIGFRGGCPVALVKEGQKVAAFLRPGDWVPGDDGRWRRVVSTRSTAGLVAADLEGGRVQTYGKGHRVPWATERPD